MNSRLPLAFLVALALLTGVTSAPAQAGNTVSQFTFANNFFSASPACPVNQFPTFESIVPVPAIIDPFEEDFIPFFCQIQVDRKGNPVKKAKGTFETDLIVIDNVTGEAETFPIRSGKFKTGSNGIDTFDFDIPAELFADGFESGDVSAWSYTRSDFTNKKRADNASVSCGTSSSKSNN